MRRTLLLPLGLALLACGGPDPSPPEDPERGEGAGHLDLPGHPGTTERVLAWLASQGR